MRDWQSFACSSGSRECLLSVIVPVYNYHDRVAACLESVVTQLTSQCELIVVDDGSTDNTQSVIKDFVVAENVAAGYVLQNNQGPGAARNRGIALSCGRWIMPLDADDTLLPEALASILAVLKKSDSIDLLVGGHVVLSESGSSVTRLPGPISDNPKRRVLSYLLCHGISILHGATVFARELLERCPYPEHIRQSEDVAIFAYALSCPRVVLLDIPLVIINKHHDSLRHDVRLALDGGQCVADQVFRYLPPEYERYRSQFEAQRALSAFRGFYRAQCVQEADFFFRKAVSLSWRQALRWSYLSKWIRMRLRLLLMGKRTD